MLFLVARVCEIGSFAFPSRQSLRDRVLCLPSIRHGSTSLPWNVRGSVHEVDKHLSSTGHVVPDSLGPIRFHPNSGEPYFDKPPFLRTEELDPIP